MEIRDVHSEDLPRVLELNESGVPNVNSIPIEMLRWFAATAPYFRVAWIDDRLAGFLIVLGADSSYDSINYLWFRARYDEFVYIDRIVVALEDRSRGVGGALYDDLDRFAAGRAKRIACEVNVIPRNETSLRFHHARGFREVGQQPTEGGTKRVSLMIKPLEQPEQGAG